MNTPTYAQWRTLPSETNNLSVINGEIFVENSMITLKFADYENQDFLKKNYNSFLLSNCTHLFYSNSSQIEYNADVQGNCGDMVVETLHKLLKENFIEIVIDYRCIFGKIEDTLPNSSAKIYYSHDIVENRRSVNQDGEEANEEVKSHLNTNENTRNNSVNNYIREEILKVKTIIQLVQTIKMFKEETLMETDLVSIYNELKTLRSFFDGNIVQEKQNFLKKNISVLVANGKTGIQNVFRTINSEISKSKNGSFLREVEWIRCLLTLELIEEFEDEDYDENQAPIIKIFQRYIDPIVHSIIFTIGVFLNGTLILVFARQRHLWTPPNIMIFNLALVDLFALFFSVLAYCFSKLFQPYIYHNEFACRYFVAVRPTTISLSCLSVVSLSILRYVATGKKFSLHSNDDICNVSTRTRFMFYILLVWIISLTLSVPYPLMVTFSDGKCFKYGDSTVAKIVTLFEFLFYCVLLPSIMISFNTMTVRRLRESTRELDISLQQNGLDVVRHRTANMLMTYIIVFLISYVPHYFLRVLRPYGLVETWETTYRCLYKVSYYMVFMNYIFNPIVLYIVSKTFRKFFNHYFSNVYNMSLKLLSHPTGR